MEKLKITVSGSESKTRHTWSINPVTRVHENNPKRNKKKERQKSKLLLKKAHDDAPFEFPNPPSIKFSMMRYNFKAHTNKTFSK